MSHEGAGLSLGPILVAGMLSLDECLPLFSGGSFEKQGSTSTSVKIEQNLSTTNSRQQHLEKISRFMDSSIRLPGGSRIGWDGIIGLIPGIGDVVGMGVSSYILVSAIRLGASRSTVVRMIGNIGIETVVGAVPLLGDVFDLIFKANSRNMKILQSQQLDPAVTHRKSLVGLSIVLLIVAFVFLLLAWTTLSLIAGLFNWIF